MKKRILASALCGVILLAGCTPSNANNSSNNNDPVYLYQASETTAFQLYSEQANTTETVCGAYIQKDLLPGMPKEECTGAAKVSAYSVDWRTYDKIFIELNYTSAQLEQMKDTYKSAKFQVYFEVPSNISIIYQLGKSHVLSFVESFNSGWSFNQVHRNVWMSYEIYLSDLIASMRTDETSEDDKTAYLFAGCFTDGYEVLPATMNVYIGDITLIKKAA